MSPTIVICPGAWPLHSFFQPLAQAFEAAGYPTIISIAPSYPASDPSSLPTTNPNTAYLRTSVLEPLLSEGKDAVLWMHSYGGAYAPGALGGLSKKERAAKGLAGGVVAGVFTAAFIAPKGTSAIQAMGFGEGNLPEWIDIDPNTAMVRLVPAHARTMLFHDLPEAEADRLAASLPAQPFACFATPVSWDPYHDPNYRGAFGYLLTEADRIMPFELQQKNVETAEISETEVLEGSSHSPHLENPVELAEKVVKMVERITRIHFGDHFLSTTQRLSK